MEKFIHEENLALFKKRLADAHGDAEREVLSKLLADEEAKEPPPKNRCAGTSEQTKQIREGPMTTAGQALLFASEAFCLTFAAIALVYFADRVRSDFLRKR